MAGSDSGYEVRLSDAGGWKVLITDPGGAVVSERACRDGAEARTYASTVRQHAYWLSPEAFRSYYQLPEPA